jgi:trimeric autotransporter adhesin
VQQVASLTLVQNGAQNATPGSLVYYPHTLTNTGNGSDTFSLTATSGAVAFSMTSVQIFADNGSGQPTGLALTSTGPLASNAAFKFIVVGTLPGTATAGQANAITLTAASLFDGTKTATNTDTTTVTNNAVVTLTKAVSATSGAPNSGPYTYSLTYTNTGNSTATDVVISDTLAAGLVYKTNSARWSVTGPATVLSDGGGRDAGASRAGSVGHHQLRRERGTGHRAWLDQQHRHRVVQQRRDDGDRIIEHGAFHRDTDRSGDDDGRNPARPSRTRLDRELHQHRQQHRHRC